MARALWVDPYEQQAVDLLQQPAKARAAALQQIADAQAHAAEVTGQANAQAAMVGGQAAGQAAQAIGNVPSQIAAAREQSMKMQGLQADTAFKQQQLQQAQAGQAFNGKINQILASGIVGDDGKVDRGKLTMMMSQQNIPIALQAQTMKTLDDVEGSVDKARQAKVDGLADVAHAALQNPLTQTPAGFMTLAALAKANGMASESDLAGIGAHLADGVDPTALLSGIRSLSEKYKDVNKPVLIPPTPRGGGPAQLVPPTGGAPIAVGQTAPPEQPTEAGIAMQAAGGNAGTAMGMLKPPVQPTNEWKDVLLDGKPAKVVVNPKTNVVTDLAGTVIDNPANRIKPVPPASTQINAALVPSGDALDQAADRYLATGQLPSMGMGQAGAAARVAVMNRAAQKNPQASLALNSATFKADSGNLSNLQKTEGTLSAFENTAGKNLDQFLSLAAKIPDTGVPWLNQPIRSVNASVLGSADQAAFNAARDVAMREIARVTNDPKLSGALTDSARAEVSGLSPANATFSQIQRVAQVLKQDMANVHAGINDQIATVKAGMQNNPAAPAKAPSVVPTKRYNPQTGKVEDIKPSGDDD